MATKHGSDSTYRNHACRCEACTDAHRQAANARNKRLRETPGYVPKLKRVPLPGSPTLSGIGIGSGKRGRPRTIK